MALVIGLNSGSSFDGIDVVLIEIVNGADGTPARPPDGSRAGRNSRPCHHQPSGQQYSRRLGGNKICYSRQIGAAAPDGEECVKCGFSEQT
jgi:hypothetical protein